MTAEAKTFLPICLQITICEVVVNDEAKRGAGEAFQRKTKALF